MLPEILRQNGFGVPSDIPKFRRNINRLGRAMLKVQDHKRLCKFHKNLSRTSDVKRQMSNAKNVELQSFPLV